MQVSKQQVERFLELVRGLTLTGDSLESAIRANAEAAREAALNCFAVRLPTDPSGVQALDELLNAMHTAVRPRFAGRLRRRSISAQDISAVSASLGAHLCELVRPRMRGEWGFAEFEGERQAVLILAPGNLMAVPQKAGKQFANGKADSVRFFFGIAAAFAQARVQYANMSPEERLALKEKMAAYKERMRERKLRAKADKKT